jgi:NAD(P)-dependent dehydrogenase (short-subunit alcohol dehydrogenase family)
VHEGRKQNRSWSAHAGSRLKLIDAPGRSRLIRLYLRPSRAAAGPTSATSSSIGRSATSSSSAAGRFGYPNRSPYSTAKWGLIGFTKTLAIELGEHNIRANATLPGAVDGDRILKAGDIGFTKALAMENAKGGVTVNVICPGYINTEMAQAEPKEVLEKRILPLIPIGRLGEPEEIAAPWCSSPPTRPVPSPARRCRSTVASS